MISGNDNAPTIAPIMIATWINAVGNIRPLRARDVDY